MKKRFSRIFHVVCCIMMATTVCNAQNLTGSGTESDPYQISSQTDLETFAKDVNSGISYKDQFIKLTDNIVCNYNKNKLWTPIGNYNKSFQGTFDGNGKTISKLYYDNSYQNYVGLFGNNQGTIKNVGVVDSYFNGQAGIGGVCGLNNGIITNCYNTGKVSGKTYVGGVCGENTGTIENCYNIGEVSGGEYSWNVGGVCGYNYNGDITNCYNTGEVSGSQYIGGVCGYNDIGTITNCYNTGEVSGNSEVGGVCGYNEGTITNCYNTGVVSGSQYFGGVCGDNYNATITNCYYLFDTDNGKDAKTKEQFNNGFVAYKLSQADNGGVWGQDLSNNKSLPTLYGSKVYKTDNKYVNSDNGFLADNKYEEPRKDNNGVYLIANAGNLYWFAQYVNNGNVEANAILTDNIVVNKEVLVDGELKPDETFREWTPIANNDNSYKGTFDGNGKTISGLYFNNPNQYYVGLFGSNEGTIKNVGVVDSYFNEDSFVGGVCVLNIGTITNCYNTGVVSGLQAVGGVCGWNEGIITNCYNTGEVSGSDNVGGVCGENNGTITNCYNTGEVRGGYIGGVCGFNFFGTITNCYNTGEVSGGEESEYIGGVCGYNFSTIENCYNTGKVSGMKENVGGVCGYNFSTITNCYTTGKVSGGDKVGGVCGYNVGTITNCYNTGVFSGTKNIGGVCGENNNAGTITNCYYLSDADNENNAKTQEQFNNGCVAYLLSQGNNGGVWGQDLSKDKSLPMLNGSKVYKNTCEDVLLGYSNEDKSYEKHEYENGICKHCGLYQLADINTDGYYEIANAGNLYWFAQYVNKGGENLYANAILVNNIVVNTDVLVDGKLKSNLTFREWTSIGNDYNKSFQGTFDGNGKTISGLYFDNSDQYYVGLFGKNKGTIKNVGVVDSYFNGNQAVGGVCGYNEKGTITNCYNTGEVSGSEYIGGVCGINDYGTITNCYNTGEVSGSKYIGGVCGDNFEDTITNCYNTGVVSGSEYIGGVSGYNYNSDITNCYNTGVVSGGEKSEYIGGVSGYNYNSDITNCYNTGVVSGGEKSEYIGGVSGYNYNSDITNCYNTGEVNGKTYIGGVSGYNEGTITNCYNTGVVSGGEESEYIGGVCGWNYEGNITNCYNTGEVSGNSEVGGVCGYNEGTFTNCYDFKLNGGTMGEYSIVVNEGNITLPTKEMMSLEDYKFDGWCANEDLTDDAITSEAEFSDVHTLYAKWVENSTPTAIKAVEAENNKTIKTIKDGQIVIIRNGVMYDMQGRKL